MPLDSPGDTGGFRHSCGNNFSKRPRVASLQIMWAHLQLIRVEGIGYLQIIRAEKTDVCSSYGLCLQAATVTMQQKIHMHDQVFNKVEDIMNHYKRKCVF